MPLESTYFLTALRKELGDFKNQMNRIELYSFTLTWLSEFVDRQAKVGHFSPSSTVNKEKTSDKFRIYLFKKKPCYLPPENFVSVEPVNPY